MLRPAVLAAPLLLLLPFAAQAQVPGTYRRTCINVSQDGSLLSARCRTANGGFGDTTLDIDQCGRSLIVNSNGRLLCGNARGTFRPVDTGYRRRYDPDGQDGGGYRPPPPRPRYAPDDQDDGSGFRPPPPRPRYFPDPDQ